MFCAFFSLVDTISCSVAKRPERVGKANTHIFQTYLQNRVVPSVPPGVRLKNRIWQPGRWREWEYIFSRNGLSFSWTFSVIQQSPGSCQLRVWCNVWERAAEYTWLNKIFDLHSYLLGSCTYRLQQEQWGRWECWAEDVIGELKRDKKNKKAGGGEVSIWITPGLSFSVAFRSDRPKPGRVIPLLNVKNIRLECGTCGLGHPLQLPCVAQQARPPPTRPRQESRDRAPR